MRILAVIGSPRKGNTYKLVQRIEDRLKAAGPVEVEYLFLRDSHLEFCRGCFVCLTRGEEHCPIKDDRAEIERRLLAADGVIFASPVYAMNVTALMKNLMDRLAYTMHRPRFFGQTAMIVCTTGGIGRRETIHAISVLGACGFNIVSRIGVVAPPPPRSFIAPLDASVQRKVNRAADTFFRAIRDRKPPSPSLMEQIAFRAKQAGLALLEEENPADHAYFQERGWFDPRRNYYVEARVNPLYDLVARGAARIVRRHLSRQKRGIGSGSQ